VTCPQVRKRPSTQKKRKINIGLPDRPKGRGKGQCPRVRGGGKKGAKFLSLCVPKEKEEKKRKPLWFFQKKKERKSKSATNVGKKRRISLPGKREGNVWPKKRQGVPVDGRKTSTISDWYVLGVGKKKIGPILLVKEKKKKPSFFKKKRGGKKKKKKGKDQVLARGFGRKKKEGKKKETKGHAPPPPPPPTEP